MKQTEMYICTLLEFIHMLKDLQYMEVHAVQVESHWRMMMMNGIYIGLYKRLNRHENT